jgi:tetratricopeptide (TPR) repeat protein
MNNKRSLALAIGVMVLGNASVQVWAARKYYPPGFKPPSDQTLVPATPTPVEQPKPVIITVPQPGGKQVIIKTVPVTVEKTVTVAPKPKDPLVVLMEERRYFDALRMVDGRLKKSPNNLTWQLFRGKILREQGEYAKAMEQYTSILDGKNRSQGARAEALNGIGWTQYQKAMHERQVGNTGDANASLRASDTAFRQAARLNPDIPYVWAGLGQVCLANGQVQDAETWIKKAKKLSPNNLTVQLAEADLLLAQHKPEDALPILYGIKKTTTREPEVYMLLARASMDTGKVDDAIINLKQLLQLQPDHTEALKLLSQSYERKMKPEDAEVLLEKAIALNPLDEDSVNALLKIYDQHHDNGRAVLVLQTLLKDHPGHPGYSLALLHRFAEDGRWDDVYDQGGKLIQQMLAEAPEGSTAQTVQDSAQAQQALLQKEEIVNLFARSVYQRGRGMLDRRPLLKTAEVQQAQTFAQINLERESRIGGPYSTHSLLNRLSLLLIDPMAALPLLPPDFHPQAQDLPLAIQIAFLQGEHARPDQWVEQAKSSTTDKLAFAQSLYQLGDYTGAQTLVDSYLSEHSESGEARQLKKNITADQESLAEHLSVLDMLPRRIPDDYWRKTASEILELGSTDGAAHGTLGLALEKRRQPELALMQLRLAAKYADTPEARHLWTRRADKAARSLGRK